MIVDYGVDQRYKLQFLLFLKFNYGNYNFSIKKDSKTKNGNKHGNMYWTFPETIPDICRTFSGPISLSISILSKVLKI